MTTRKLKAAVFYYVLRPIMNRSNLVAAGWADCPMCGELLTYYKKDGFLHMADGDADCYGALGKGKGSFK